MNREKAKANLLVILGSEPTEEQITSYLDGFHTVNKELSDSLEVANKTITDLNQKVTNLTQSEIELNAIKQSQLTEQEKLELQKKEIEKNLELSQQKLAEASVVTNTAKAREILSEIGGVNEELLNSIVTKDETQTIKNANALLTQIKNVQVATETKTKQDLATIDIKPAPSNVQDDNVMTWDKFSQMSADEQNRFAEEHPNEFEKLQ